MTQSGDDFSFHYQIDSDDLIVSVDAAWISFAEHNNAADIAQHSIIGESIWDYIATVEVQHLYKMVFNKVRTGDDGVAIPFRCDSPTSRRFMELRIEPLEDSSLMLTGILVREESRPYVALLDIGERDPDGFLDTCSWCKRILMDDDSWLEVEDAIREMELFDANRLPGLTHVICPDCMSKFDFDFDLGS